MHHHFQKRSNQELKHLEDLSPIIEKAIQKGQLSPFAGSHWIALQNEIYLGDVGLVQFRVKDQTSDYHVEKLSDAKKQVINSKRKELGMNSFEDFYKKIKFQLDNRKSPFIFSFPLKFDIWEVNEQMADEMKKYFIKFKELEFSK